MALQLELDCVGISRPRGARVGNSSGMSSQHSSTQLSVSGFSSVEHNSKHSPGGLRDTPLTQMSVQSPGRGRPSVGHACLHMEGSIGPRLPSGHVGLMFMTIRIEGDVVGRLVGRALGVLLGGIVGRALGWLLGSIVGTPEWTLVGAPEGVREGAREGYWLGSVETEGTAVGSLLGTELELGATEGEPVGGELGFTVGEEVGATVGELLGREVGELVGREVGAATGVLVGVPAAFRKGAPVGETVDGAGSIGITGAGDPLPGSVVGAYVS